MENNRILTNDIDAIKIALETTYSFDDILSIHPRVMDFRLIHALKKIGMEEDVYMSGKEIWEKTYKCIDGFIDIKAIVIKTFNMEADGCYLKKEVVDAINSYLGLN